MVNTPWPRAGRPQTITVLSQVASPSEELGVMLAFDRYCSLDRPAYISTACGLAGQVDHSTDTGLVGGDQGVFPAQALGLPLHTLPIPRGLFSSCA